MARLIEFGKSPPTYLFYLGDGNETSSPRLPAAYSHDFWRPSLAHLMPPGVRREMRWRFSFRWTMHQFHLMSNRDYRVLVIRNHARLVHYSAMTGGYWRFPFMADDDIQIGDVWTHPDHRGRGLARFAIRTIARAVQKPGRHIWYVVSVDNAASIRAVEQAGFVLFARGAWIKPLGLKFAGSYVIESVVPNVSAASRAQAL